MARMIDLEALLKGCDEDAFDRNMSTTLGHSRAAFSEPRLWWGDS